MYLEGSVFLTIGLLLPLCSFCEVMSSPAVVLLVQAGLGAGAIVVSALTSLGAVVPRPDTAFALLFSVLANVDLIQVPVFRDSLDVSADFSLPMTTTELFEHNFSAAFPSFSMGISTFCSVISNTPGFELDESFNLEVLSTSTPSFLSKHPLDGIQDFPVSSV